MSGERIVVWGTQKVLESNGLMVVNAAVAQADDATYALETDGNSFPDAEFVLTGTFGVTPIDGSALMLYARPLDVDGTLDAEVPEANRPTRLVGTFVVNNSTVPQTMVLTGYDLPRKADYYIHNNGTGQSLSAGWTLKVTPRSEKIAA